MIIFLPAAFHVSPLRWLKAALIQSAQYEDAVGPFSAFEASHDEGSLEADALQDEFATWVRRDARAWECGLARVCAFWIEFGYFRAGTSRRHSGAHFFKSNRFVLCSNNNRLFRRLAVRMIKILDSPCRHVENLPESLL
jgi:hypothetical protein